MSNLLVGCDPEVFLSYGNKFVSAYGLFPGTKEEPFRVEKGAIQVDGLALEFNIDPASSEEEFLNNIDVVLKQMEEMVKRVDKKLKINFLPVAKFDEKEFEQMPEECKILGCDPDFNVTGFMNIAPEDLIHKPIRTGSGHIHLGWTDGVDPFSPEHFGDALQVAKHFHQYTPFRLTAEEQERLKYYGGEGAFRPKPYGVELRSYSNVWVEHEKTRKQIYEFAVKTMNEIKI